MWMMKHDCWLELTSEAAHLHAPLPPVAAFRQVRVASVTEHVQVMVTKNKYSLISNREQVGV